MTAQIAAEAEVSEPGIAGMRHTDEGGHRKGCSMLTKTAAMLLLVLVAGGCTGSAESDATPDISQETRSTTASPAVGEGSPAPGATPTEAVTGPAPVPNDWHTIEYGQIAFEVPAEWTLDSAQPCTGGAIVAPPRVRTSCPPQPSALIIRGADGSPRTGPSTRQIALGGFVVRLTGVDAKTAQAITASVRTR